MFTGIIEEVGSVVSITSTPKSKTLKIKGNIIFDDLKIGDSVSTNGVCLTVTKMEDKFYYADVMHETMEKTSLKDLKVNSKVNLERAMSGNSRFGGHIVSGHIDGTGRIASIKRDDIAHIVTIKAQKEILKYIIKKGSIAIDGISLTVVDVNSTEFWVSLIPHTSKETSLLSKKVGDRVNLENDVIGKYVEKLLDSNKGLSKEMLEKYGF